MTDTTTPAATIPPLDPAGARRRLRALAEALPTSEGLGHLTERLYGKDADDDWNRARVAADLVQVLGEGRPDREAAAKAIWLVTSPDTARLLTWEQVRDTPAAHLAFDAAEKVLRLPPEALAEG